jgi:hypothetical protein
MVLTPMLRQSIASIFAVPAQAVHLFSGQPGTVFNFPGKIQNSIPEQRDFSLASLYSPQLVAPFAGHVAMTATQALVSPKSVRVCCHLLTPVRTQLRRSPVSQPALVQFLHPSDCTHCIGTGNIT